MKLKLLPVNSFTTKRVKKCIVCKKLIYPENLRNVFKVTPGHMKKGVFIQDRPSQYAHLECFEGFEML